MRKKKILVSAACLAAASAIALTGCSTSQTQTFSGAYWNDNPKNTGIVPVYEKLKYDVDVVAKAPFSSSEMKNDDLRLVPDKSASYYTVELSAEKGADVYTLKTELKMVGKYEFGENKEYKIEGDTVTTETTFKGYADGLAPVKTVKKVRNVVPSSAVPTEEGQFHTVGYTQTIEYGSSVATSVILPDAGSEDYLKGREETIEYKKYNKKTYVDNDMMLFYFRAFEFEDGFSYTFSVIDAMGQSLSSVKCSGLTDSAGKSTAKTPIKVSSYIETSGGTTQKANDKTFNCYGVKFATQGEYGQTFLYAYYAVNPKGEEGNDKDNANRHRAIAVYQPALYHTGYVSFTLHETSLDR